MAKILPFPQTRIKEQDYIKEFISSLGPLIERLHYTSVYSSLNEEITDREPFLVKRKIYSINLVPTDKYHHNITDSLHKNIATIAFKPKEIGKAVSIQDLDPNIKNDPLVIIPNFTPECDAWEHYILAHLYNHKKRIEVAELKLNPVFFDLEGRIINFDERMPEIDLAISELIAKGLSDEDCIYIDSEPVPMYNIRENK